MWLQTAVYRNSSATHPVPLCQVLHFPMTHDNDLRWRLRVPAELSLMDRQSGFCLFLTLNLDHWECLLMVILLCLKITPGISHYVNFWKSQTRNHTQILVCVCIIRYPFVSVVASLSNVVRLNYLINSQNHVLLDKFWKSKRIENTQKLG